MLLEPYEPGLLPFIDYVYSDKSDYTPLSEKLLDIDNDFLIGDSGGILLNIDFIFVNSAIACQAGAYYELNKRYCPFPDGTLEATNWWREETNRRRYGFTYKGRVFRKDIEKYKNASSNKERESYVKDIHITGTHYHYLNYYRIQRIPSEEEKSEAHAKGDYQIKTIEVFPTFWDLDYWKSKVDALSYNNGKSKCVAKARRKGYSHFRAADSANQLNLNPGYKVINISSIEDYLTDPGGLSDFTRLNLEFLENNCPPWRRGLFSEKQDAIRLGYKKAGHGHKMFGWNASLLSYVTGTKANAGVGKAANTINVEESGTINNLNKLIGVMSSTTESGLMSVGNATYFGTSGADVKNWGPFSELFYNPKMIFGLEFENVYDDNSRSNLCGFWVAQVWGLQPYIDDNGNSQLIISYHKDKALKAVMEQNLKLEDFVIYSSQRANTPAEAFLVGSNNMFATPELSRAAVILSKTPKLDNSKLGLFIRNKDTGIVEFVTNEELARTGDSHPYILEYPFDPKKDFHGCWYMMYDKPYFTEEVLVKDITYGAMDPVAIDKIGNSIKEITNKHSLNCMGIFAYPHGYTNYPSDTILAMFIGRPQLTITASIQFLNALEYYGAKGLVEADRGTVVADARKLNKLELLLKNPEDIINNKAGYNYNANYGIVIGQSTRANTGLTLLYNWMYDVVSVNEDGIKKYRIETIPDLGILREFSHFGNANADRISMLRVAAFQRMAYLTLNKKPKEELNKTNTKTALSKINIRGILG